mmetsp:Transcript_40812/g.113312  ORF Transcript_40812/g.113312 Transcript_40812/m.113312 type:complete len:97 (+) Transcript_40812:204-494(+)
MGGGRTQQHGVSYAPESVYKEAVGESGVATLTAQALGEVSEAPGSNGFGPGEGAPRCGRESRPPAAADDWRRSSCKNVWPSTISCMNRSTSTSKSS